MLEGGGGGSSGGCCDCAPGAAGWRRALADIVTSDWFGNGSTALVILNMMVMCCPYAGQTEEWAAQVEGAATVITVLFMIEMALKLVGLGCKGYWEDGWNQLDGCAAAFLHRTIVLLSAVDLGMTVLASGGGANLSFLRILRMLRVLRMLRLMKSWKGLYKIILTFGKALPQVPGHQSVSYTHLTLPTTPYV